MTLGETVRVRLVKRVGEGAMGAVYRAEHVATGLPYAVKLLKSHLCGDGQALRRFFREAIAASSVHHPGVVSVVDAGRSDGIGFYVMEYLDGEDLASTQRREGAIDWTRARHMVLQICDAMATVHAHGIIHRDLKPANCFRMMRGTDPDFIKVLDFGVAKVTLQEASTLTGDGALIGTIPYMAPEILQSGGRGCDERSEVWALGVLLYELVAGQRPFRAPNVLQLMSVIQEQDTPPLPGGVREWPAQLQHALERALCKDPNNRFPDMVSFASALGSRDPVALDERVDGAPRSEAEDRPLDATQSPATGALAGASLSFGFRDEYDRVLDLIDEAVSTDPLLLSGRGRSQTLPGGVELIVTRGDLVLEAVDTILCWADEQDPFVRRLCEFGGPKLLEALGSSQRGDGPQVVMSHRLAAGHVVLWPMQSEHESQARARTRPKISDKRRRPLRVLCELDRVSLIGAIRLINVSSISGHVFLAMMKRACSAILDVLITRFSI